MCIQANKWEPQHFLNEILFYFFPPFPVGTGCFANLSIPELQEAACPEESCACQTAAEVKQEEKEGIFFV